MPPSLQIMPFITAYFATLFRGGGVLKFLAFIRNAQAVALEVAAPTTFDNNWALFRFLISMKEI